MRDVAIIIPTLRRLDSLERAVRSVAAQTRALDRVAAVVVADNDPDGSAAPLIARLQTETDLPLIYVPAPVPGVATARNAGLAATEAPLIAFLDDDEAAGDGWLAELLNAQTETGADVVFGPIRGRVPEGSGWATAYLERFFGREGPTSNGRLNAPYGCGNSLMVRATALPGSAPFALSADQIGGEDDQLFAELSARGGIYGWAANAWVDEFAPPHRATLRYALKRAFAYGQGPSQTAAEARNWPALLRWMVIGAGQAAVYGTQALALTVLRHPSRAQAWDRAARGLGKLLWMRAFQTPLYGQALLNPKS